MKKDEAIKEIRKVRKTCRGPLLMSDEQQASFFKSLQAATPESLPKIVAGISEARRAFGMKPEFLEELDEETVEVHRAARRPFPPSMKDATEDQIIAWCVRAVRARAGDVGKACRYDFNETIIRHPFDGQERAYACPRCKSKGTFRSPFFKID